MNASINNGTSKSSYHELVSHREIAEKQLEGDRRPSSLTLRVLGATFTASLGAISIGFIIAYPSPAGSQLKSQMNWSDESLAWFNSLSCLGANLGSPLGLYTIEKLGRKFNLMLTAFLYVAGWIMIATTQNSFTVMSGRCLSGCALGISSFTVPLYIAEISPARYRGLLGGTYGVALTFGILLVYCLGNVLSWRWLAIACAVPSAIMSVLTLFYPETPRWLANKGRKTEACSALMYFTKFSNEQCESEFKEIKDSLAEDGESLSWREITKPAVLRPFIISIMLVTFQQFTGINAVCAYTSKIVREIDPGHASFAEIGSALLQFLGAIVCYVIIDKFGRRVLLIYPNFLMFVGLTVLGASRYFDNIPGFLTLLSLGVYVFCFSIGLGTVTTVVMTEILPTRVRGVASGIASQVMWLSAFIVVRTYVDLENAIHSYGCYWLYAAVCLAATIFVYFVLPETKGKTLEELQLTFTRKEEKFLSKNANGEEHISKYGSCISHQENTIQSK